MIYQAFEAYSDAIDPVRQLVARLVPLWAARAPAPGMLSPLRSWMAAGEVIAQARLTGERPAFGISTVMVREQVFAVTEEVVDRTPFCALLRFRKDGDVSQPKVLLVAPMSGHFATLLRGTARTLLGDHDVYITDWRNARDVSLASGAFGLDDYVTHLIRFLEVMGPGSHLVAVCQPCVPALAAVAVMAEDGNPCQPATMTLMAGPIDARIDPTQVNELAMRHSIQWFENNMIGCVPSRYPGARRRVYPGFMQIMAFMSLNLERHIGAFRDLYDAIVDGDDKKAETIKTFYSEYFAAADLPAEFYLETVATIFQEFALACGALTYRGRRVDPRAIKRTALLTVEGQNDDICSVGQTLAAQDLCSSIRPYLKRHYVQPGVGHYGVFNGKRWDREVYPMVRDFIHSAP